MNKVIVNRRVPRDVFLNTDVEKFVSCQQKPKISFNPWTGDNNYIFSLLLNF